MAVDYQDRIRKVLRVHHITYLDDVQGIGQDHARGRRYARNDELRHVVVHGSGAREPAQSNAMQQMILCGANGNSFEFCCHCKSQIGGERWRKMLADEVKAQYEGRS